MKNLLLLLLSFGVLLSQSQNSKTNRLDSLFTSLYSKNQFNGNVLVADKGEIIFKKSFGLADEVTGRKLNTETIFELASVSKQFTAMGIVQLKKEGKLDYDEKLSKYIPELEFYGDITIRHLLNHTSGLPDYMALFQKHWDKSKFATNQDIINLLVKHKPEVSFLPKEKFEYSNTGYALLASIVEKVSGITFTEYLAQKIFKPLKMDNTFVYRSRYENRQIDNLALGHIVDETGNKVRPDHFGKEIPFYYLDGVLGDGMVNSTLEDLQKWDRALYANDLVNENDKNVIFKSVKTTDGNETNYGFGWAVGTSDVYGKIVNHSGSWAGNLTFIERHLDNDKTFVILQNNSTPLIKNPAKEIRKILYNLPISVPKTIKLNDDELNKYEGTYANPNFPIKIRFFAENGVLMGQGDGQGAFPLDAYANHTFKFDPAQISLVFNLKENTIAFTQAGQSFTFTRE